MSGANNHDREDEELPDDEVNAAEIGSSVLSKAAVDTYIYFCQLRSGAWFKFGRFVAGGPPNTPAGEWGTLRDIQDAYIPNAHTPDTNQAALSFGRGVEVRLSEIVILVDYDS
ncbi:MAG TPA: hypothetical protein VG713_10940 [Pirellulales bacterium]|nr:hypothetical protein [Pirellulales bacterium]